MLESLYRRTLKQQRSTSASQSLAVSLVVDSAEPIVLDERKKQEKQVRSLLRTPSMVRYHRHCCGKLLLAGAGYTFCESPIFGCHSFIATDTGIKAVRRERDFKFFFYRTEFDVWRVVGKPLCQYRAPIQTRIFPFRDVFTEQKILCLQGLFHKGPAPCYIF